MFAHRFKDTHTNRRKKLRRMARDGKARVIETKPHGWLYEILTPEQPRQGNSP
jgi:hypothetical protein